MVFYNRLLLKIESSEYRRTGKCTAVHTMPKKYHSIQVYQYFCTHARMHTHTHTLQLDSPSDWRPGGRGFIPRRGRQHSFVEIDHEIFSTVNLSLLLIQEGQLSVSGKRMCTILVNRLED